MEGHLCFRIGVAKGCKQRGSSLSRGRRRYFSACGGWISNSCGTQLGLKRIQRPQALNSLNPSPMQPRLRAHFGNHMYNGFLIV